MKKKNPPKQIRCLMCNRLLGVVLPGGAVKEFEIKCPRCKTVYAYGVDLYTRENLSNTKE